MPEKHFHIGGILIMCHMVLHMNDAYIIYHHMDIYWSVGLVQIYFSHPKSLVVQCWVHATTAFSDAITPIGL